jgi:hypothetical protein
MLHLPPKSSVKQNHEPQTRTSFSSSANRKKSRSEADDAAIAALHGCLSLVRNCCLGDVVFHLMPIICEKVLGENLGLLGTLQSPTPHRGWSGCETSGWERRESIKLSNSSLPVGMKGTSFSPA